MTHFALVTADGESLGPIELGRPDWPAGSIIYRGGEPNLRVVDIIPSDDDETFTILVVERLPEQDRRMAGWMIVGGPRDFDELEDGRDISHGWAWDIERNGERRTVRVAVVGTSTPSWPDECRRAITTSGRNIVIGLLNRDDPPLTVGITTTGVEEQQQPPVSAGPAHAELPAFVKEEEQTLPRYEFWHSPITSISWHLGRDPEIGAEIVVGEDVFRVVARRQPSPISDCAAYDVELVRKATLKEAGAAAVALNDLRLTGGWD